MAENLIHQRFEKIRAELSKQKIDGAIITSKPNQQYLVGFTSESPMILFVPGSEQNVAPTILTSPLEENIVKDSLPFKEMDVKVIFKDIDARTEKALKDHKYWTISLDNEDVYVPHFILEDTVGDYYKKWLKDLQKEDSLNISLPNHPLAQIVGNAVQKMEVLKNEFDGHQVIHPRYYYNKFLVEIFRKANINKIGLEYDRIQYGSYQNLANAYQSLLSSDFNTVPVEKILLNQRIIKDRDELDLMRKAAEIGTKGFLAAEEWIHELKTENEVQAKAEFAMKLNGSKKPAFDTIVVSGENSAYPHGHATDKQIEKGDLVTVDIGAIWKGYNSDMTRTVFAGLETPEESLKLFKLVNQAHALGLSLVKPGNRWGDPDIAVRKFFKDNDVLKYYNHSLGHGVGVEVHEMPGISPRLVGDDNILKEGMVLTIEPGIYIPGLGGARTEDTVVVTSDGYEKITKCKYLFYD